MTYFISDLHFGHKNVMKYDNRPFETIEDQDREIIKRWNNKVKTDDDVYILGDVSFYNPKETAAILNCLKGHKHLIIGNHDGKFLKDKVFRYSFDTIAPYTEIYTENKVGIVLSHYPIPCFKNSYYGWFHLYGHVHNTFEANIIEHLKKQMINLYGKQCNMYNVGCMIPYMDYTPQTLEEITEGANKYEVCLV